MQKKDRQTGGDELKSLRVVRQNLAEQTAETLREAIIGGTFKPGERLPETQLSQSMGVSRGTVRAALAALERDDLVICERYSAWKVQTLEAADIWETYTLRASLEGLAARLAATRITDPIRADLKKVFAALASAKTPKQRINADLALHLAIVGHAGHKRLNGLYAGVLNRIRWIYAVSETRSPDQIDLREWHRPLVDAICQGRSEDAAEYAYQIIMKSMQADLERLAAAGETGISA